MKKCWQSTDQRWFMSNGVNVARPLSTSVLAVGMAVALGAQQTPGQPMSGQQPSTRAPQPTRDTPAQSTDVVATPTGRITGRVVAVDNGQPIRRARVFVTAVELSGGRGTLTDDSGVFDLGELPAGRYTLTVSKAGF